MAISLNDINKKASKGVKSILDVILERKEEKLSGRTRKKRVLRPWESSSTDSSDPSITSNTKVMAPFEKKGKVLSDDEFMALKIQERAKELFQNISDFL